MHIRTSHPLFREVKKLFINKAVELKLNKSLERSRELSVLDIASKRKVNYSNNITIKVDESRNVNLKGSIKK
jgi:hypothetical protein